MKIVNYFIIVLIAIIITSNAYGYTAQFNTYDDTVQFLLIDNNGKRTGYDNSLKAKIEENPDIHYGMFATSDPDGDRFVSYQLVAVTPENTSGKLQIKTIGMKLNTFVLELHMRENKDYRLNNPNSVMKINGLTDIDMLRVYEIVYTPYQPMIITRISTSTDLISDITTAQKLNLIGSSEFVSEITQKINKIEEKRLKPAEKDDDHKLTPAQKAKKEYTELLSEITEKYNKPESDEFVKKEAYDVLKEDIEYIINHIQ